MGDLRRINLFEAAADGDESDPDGFRAAMNRFGPSIGAQKLGGSIYDLPPGQSICPYHYEYPVEEWLVGLVGTATVRHPEGVQEIGPGDVICFPPGPGGAHRISNEGDDEVRVLMLSTIDSPSVGVYPDSGTVGIFDTGDEAADVIFRREDARPYFDGE